MTDTIEFFKTHALISWARGEDVEALRLANARRLADAEAWAKRAGVLFWWRPDPEGGTCDAEFMDLSESLYSHADNDDMRRVTEAELAADMRDLVIAKLMEAADHLRAALDAMNLYGDAINPSIATQAAGCSYGATNDALRHLLSHIHGTSTMQAILELVDEHDETPTEALSLLKASEQ